jgi:tetratricopeptide (TPR) repeat protein
MSAGRILLYTVCSIIGFGVLMVLLALALSSGAFVGNSSHATNEASEPPEAKPPADPERLHEKWKKAVAIYQQRVQNDPQSHLDKNALAQAYMALARATGDHALFSDAEPMLRRSLEIMPRQNIEAQSALATCLLMMHRFTEALAFIEKAETETPGERLFSALRGDALLGLGRYDDAEEAFNIYAKQSPGPHAKARLARICELRGNLARARKLMLEVRVELGDWEIESQAWVRVQLGLIDLNEGRLEQARKEFADALLWTPDWPTALQFLARCEEIAGEFESARKHLNTAAEVSRTPETILPLARVEKALGNSNRGELLRAEAMRHFQVHLGMGETSHLRNHATALLQFKEKPELALELAAQDVAARDDIFSWAVLAWARSANGLHAAALEALGKALRLDTPDACLWLLAAHVYEAAGEAKKAEAAVARARAINPLVKGHEAEWLNAWR